MQGKAMHKTLASHWLRCGDAIYRNERALQCHSDDANTNGRMEMAPMQRKMENCLKRRRVDNVACSRGAFTFWIFRSHWPTPKDTQRYTNAEHFEQHAVVHVQFMRWCFCFSVAVSRCWFVHTQVHGLACKCSSLATSLTPRSNLLEFAGGRFASRSMCAKCWISRKLYKHFCTCSKSTIGQTRLFIHSSSTHACGDDCLRFGCYGQFAWNSFFSLQFFIRIRMDHWTAVTVRQTVSLQFNSGINIFDCQLRRYSLRLPYCVMDIFTTAMIPCTWALSGVISHLRYSILARVI